MKLSRPASPFERVELHGESFTLDTSGKVLVLPSGDPDVLPSFNEYVLNSNRLTLAESPFGGLKGSGSPDYAPGTLYTPTDGVYLTDVNGQNSTKTLTAGKLKELNLLTVDTTAHTVTEEFIVENTGTSNNPTVIIEGWSEGTGTLTSLTTENGRIKAVGRGTISVGFKIVKIISLAGKQFIKFKIECNTDKNLFVSLAQGANKVEFRGTRFTIPANAVTSFVLPIYAPAGTAGLYPSNVSGTMNWANDVTLYIGTEQTDESDITFYLDDIQADVALPTYIELQTPDNLTDSSLTLQAWDGSAYQTTGTYKLDSTYSAVSTTTENWKLADGTKFDDCYGSGLGRALFPKGVSAETKAGSSGSITYSANKGTSKRIGFRVDLPPSDGGRTNFNKCRMKAIISYTDTVGNVVPDISGHGNNLSIIGNPLKSTDDISFGAAGEYLTRINIPTISINSDFEVIIYCIITSVSGTQRIFANNNVASDRVVLGLQEGNLNFGLYNGSAYIKTKYITVASGLLNTQLEVRFGQLAGDTYLYINSTAGISGWSPTTAGIGVVNIGGDTQYGFSGKISYIQISDANGVVAVYQPTVSNMGSTTHDFADSTNTSYGLQNLSKPWVALYDPANSLIDFYLFTHRPKNLSFKRNDDGTIHEVTLYPGNGLIYHGQITYANLTADSNSDGIPDCLEASVEGSLTKFLQAYGMVI